MARSDRLENNGSHNFMTGPAIREPCFPKIREPRGGPRDTAT
jgi:hypothetical protein